MLPNKVCKFKQKSGTLSVRINNFLQAYTKSYTTDEYISDHEASQIFKTKIQESHGPRKQFQKKRMTFFKENSKNSGYLSDSTKTYYSLDNAQNQLNYIHEISAFGEIENNPNYFQKFYFNETISQPFIDWRTGSIYFLRNNGVYLSSVRKDRNQKEATVLSNIIKNGRLKISDSLQSEFKVCPIQAKMFYLSKRPGQPYKSIMEIQLILDEKSGKVTATGGRILRFC